MHRLRFRNQPLYQARDAARFGLLSDALRNGAFARGGAKELNENQQALRVESAQEIDVRGIDKHATDEHRDRVDRDDVQFIHQLWFRIVRQISTLARPDDCIVRRTG